MVTNIISNHVVTSPLHTLLGNHQRPRGVQGMGANSQIWIPEHFGIGVASKCGDN